MESVTLHNDIQEVPILGQWVEELGDTFMLPMPAVFQLNLALEEAVVNVMNYAYPGETGKLIHLTADKSENGDIVFQLSDEGVPFDPTSQEEPDITLSAEEREIGGLGIFLVKQLMKEITYQRNDNRNVLTMHYQIPQEQNMDLSFLDQ